MTILILGGAGFVGLNLAEAALAAGRDVVVFDQAEPPAAALNAFAELPGRLAIVAEDVTDRAALAAAMRPGLDALVLGAAITADAARDAREPETILAVNLLAQVPALELARDSGVRRVLNLSSAAAYGAAGLRGERLDEAGPAEPESLYAITKLASEQVASRLGALWRVDVVSARLSAVFGPWERATGVRDTLSPQAQLLALAEAGQEAVLARPGLRDYVYAPDVAGALLRLLDAGRLAHPLYNVSAPRCWSALDWGRRLSRSFPGFACRLAEPGETPTVDLHSPVDRPPLATDRLRHEFGWTAIHGLEDSCDHLLAWRQRHGGVA